MIHLFSRGQTSIKLKSRLLSLGLVLLFLLSACSPEANASVAASTDEAVPTETSLATPEAAEVAVSTETSPESRSWGADYPVYSIYAAPSGMALTASGGAAGSPIDQEPWNGSANQQWRFVTLSGADEGYYSIRSLDGSLCLDSAGSQLYNDGAVGLQQNSCNDEDSQKWKIVPCTAYGDHPACAQAAETVWLQVKQGSEANSWMESKGIPAGGRVMMLNCDWKKSGDCTDSGLIVYTTGMDGGFDQQWRLAIIE